MPNDAGEDRDRPPVFPLAESLAVAAVIGLVAVVFGPAAGRAQPRVDPAAATIERGVALYRARHGVFPSAAMLATPPACKEGDSFGLLVDRGLLGSVPANPRTGGTRLWVDYTYDEREGRVRATEPRPPDDPMYTP